MLEILEKYKIESGLIDVDVEIVKEDNIPKYKLIIPEISLGTSALLNSIKHELITSINITTAEILNPEIINTLKQRFSTKAEEYLLDKLPNIDKKTKDFLVTSLINEMLGLKDIEYLLSDPQLEEIIITSAKESVRVFHKKYGWLLTNILIKSEEEIQNYANIIARRIGRQITTLTPILDAHLVTGDRANAVLYPISTKGNAITIRKFARDPWTFVDLIQNKTCSSGIFALIWLAMQYEMNILISGGTASGKTSFLNTCMPFIPPNHRIISIEDTRELFLPEYLYWCPLTTREPNPEGKGEVSMLDRER
ncbi:CpaF family protein [Candidatus Woesearchaeota archaeon]|nr:CpaF family protein [Candidatus Woesearchaeota archaeon]